jgi:RHS repeat-associated protein
VLTSISTERKQREVGYLGKQVFELSNHLGNVLATITDKKLQVSLNTTSTAYFEAEVQTVQDNYAFGMQMPGRKLSGGYRYGFNGKENDNEVKGEGNSQDYGMRMYDGRIGKFLSLDPLTKQYPWYTPYQFAGNKPIWCVDLDGLEDSIATKGLFSGMKYIIEVNKDKPKIGTITVHVPSNIKLAVDLDGADVYHPNNEGIDNNVNGDIYKDEKGKFFGKSKSDPMYGVVKDNDGNPLIQDDKMRAPGFFISQNFVTISGSSNNSPDHYINSIDVPYLAVSQSFLNTTGANWGDIGIITNMNNCATTYFIIGDKKGNMNNIEMSLKAFNNLNIDLIKKVGKSYDKLKSIERVVGNKNDPLEIKIFLDSGIKGKKNQGENRGLSSEKEIKSKGEKYASQLNKKPQ